MYQYVSITLLNKQFAIENGPVEIVDLPIKEGVAFHALRLWTKWVTAPVHNAPAIGRIHSHDRRLDFCRFSASQNGTFPRENHDKT